MARPVAALLLLLASCSGTPADPAEAACARQAEDDPVVAEMQRKSAGSLDYEWRNAELLTGAKRQATLRCLRARGIAPKGGVELQKRQ